MKLDDQQPSPMDFVSYPVVETPWTRLLETGRGMVGHFASAPDAHALADARLLFAQFAMASSRQSVPAEHRAQWAADISRVCEDMGDALALRTAQLTSR